MFNDLFIPPIPPAFLSQIENIQKDFLQQAGPNVASGVEKHIDGEMDAVKERDKDYYRLFCAFRLTRYQQPIYFRELAIASSFALKCYKTFSSFEGSTQESYFLETVPFASVLASPLNGMVAQLRITPDMPAAQAVKSPCILVSQNTMQTAWVCDNIHQFFRENITKEEWESNLAQRKIKLPFDSEKERHVALASLDAFLCETRASKVRFFYEASDEELLPTRLMLSFVMAHEYAHICLQHEARFDDSTSLSLSSDRLQDLKEIIEYLPSDNKTKLLINSHRLKYFFGHQQDELEADFVAFLTLYSGIIAMPNNSAIVRKLVRAVAYTIMWADIQEVIGRTIQSGVDWHDDPLHDPQYALLSDLVWRRRYPSAHSRLGYLFDRMQDGLLEEHRKIVESELAEMELLFTLWRQIIVKASSVLSPLWTEQSDDAEAVREHFIWKGLPASVRDSIGYHDHCEAFDGHRWQEFIG